MALPTGSLMSPTPMQADFHFKLMVVFTPPDVLLSSNQRVVTVLVCV